MEWGNRTISAEHVGDYQGDAPSTRLDLGEPRAVRVADYALWASRDIPLKMLESQMRRSNDQATSARLFDQIEEMQMKRAYLHEHTRQLVARLTHDPNIGRWLLNKTPGPVTKFDCHHDVVLAYDRLCFGFGKNEYALSIVKVLANLCEYGLNKQRIINELFDHCLVAEHKNIL